jgi:hypothetical protein
MAQKAPSKASNGSAISPASSFSSVSESMKTVFTEDEKTLVQPFKKVRMLQADNLVSCVVIPNELHLELRI